MGNHSECGSRPTFLAGILAAFLAWGMPLAGSDVLAVGSNLLTNATLESTSSSAFPGWNVLSSGSYTVDTTNSHSGGASAKCVMTATGQWRGLYQSVLINQTVAKPLFFSVWSKASGVTGVADSQYAAYVVLTYTDGTISPGFFAPYFPVGTQGWNMASRIVVPAKPIKQADYYLVIHGSHTGTVWFDEASLGEATAPAITTQPGSLDLTAGASASFTAAASGSPLPAYQWETSQDGSTWTTLAGATNATYSFNCQPNQSATRFRVKAANTLGTATSNAATLTVSASGSWTVYTPLASSSDLAQGPNLLANGLFDTTSGSTFTGWTLMSTGGYVLDTTNYHTGSVSAKCVAATTGQWRGLYQTVALNQTTAKPLVFSAWSKASGVTGVADYRYAAYIILTYTDGTSSSSFYAPYFPVGTQDWSQVSKLIIPPKPVKQAVIYLGFGGSHTGTAWFDDASVTQATEQAYTFEEHTVRNVAVATYPYQGSSSLSIGTGDGLALTFSTAGGALTSIKGANGEMATGNIPASGFFLRDVHVSSDYIHPSTTVTQPSSNTLTLTAQAPDLGLNLNAAMAATTDHISVTGTLADITGQDRAVTLYFALPVDATGWTWGNDIRSSAVLATNQERGIYSEVPFGVQFTSQLTAPDLTGRISTYPMASITNLDGLALAYPIDMPAQIRLVVNTSTKQLMIAYDLGLSPHTKTPGAANFSFVIFRHAPAWGFREAWNKYISIYPNLFLKRATSEGVWIAGTALSKISGLADFQVAFHELTTNVAANLTFDNTNGIKGLRYNYTPSSYMLIMPSSSSSTDYATVMSALSSGLSSTDDSVKNGSMSTLGSAMRDASGQLVFAPLSLSHGARFTLSPDPDVVDPSYPMNAAQYKWNSSLKATYSQTTGGVLDGEYIDSFEFTPTILGYRDIHLAASDLPLVFDPTGTPAVPEVWASYEFVRWMASDVHGLNKLMMANGALGKFAFPAHVFDVMAWEANWLDSSNQYSAPQDSWFNFRRTLSYRKPYCLLMETDFSLFTNAMMKRYMLTSLFYGMYPSTFSPDGNPTTPVYWLNSTLVERDRELFKTYIPLIQKLGQAGWEPVTHVRSSNANVAVERYGSGSTMYLTVRNLTSLAQTATFTLETAGLGLSSVPTAFADLINGGTLVNTSGSTFQVAMGADEVRMYTPK